MIPATFAPPYFFNQIVATENNGCAHEYIEAPSASWG